MVGYVGRVRVNLNRQMLTGIDQFDQKREVTLGGRCGVSEEILAEFDLETEVASAAILVTSVAAMGTLSVLLVLV